jgi:tetratricopeptide repeat protein
MTVVMTGIRTVPRHIACTVIAAMRGIIILIALAVSAAPAAAEDRPWAAGVSEERKAKAQELLDRGNALALEKKYVEALEVYRSALEQWDHPGIQFSLVRCLIQLDRPVEASDHLELALKYGAAPFEPAVYSEALSYRKLLAGQIAELEVTCDQHGARLSLDGKPLATCPTTMVRRVEPGQHMIVGTREGYMINSVEVFALGAKRTRASVTLLPLSKVTKIVHRWSSWKPWVALGGGVALAGVGGLVRLEASSLMETYGHDVAASCTVMVCPVTFDAATKDAAVRDNAIAISLVSAGAAVAITSGVLLYMNRGRTVYERPAARAPVVGIGAASGGGWVTLGGGF